jgi:SAM-dependent methyltransferase
MNIATLLYKPLNFAIEVILHRQYLRQKPAPFNERSVEYRYVFQQLTRLCPQTILDAGTGKSALPSLLKTCGFAVTAIDNKSTYWESGFSNWHYHIIQDDILKPALRGSFDLVLCISVLEHIPEHALAVTNLMQLARPGGHVILTFPYHEHQYCPNVYQAPGSDVKIKPNFITQAFSRKEVDLWLRQTGAKLIDQEFWRFYTGEYWTTGAKLAKPERATDATPHQIACMLFETENSGT